MLIYVIFTYFLVIFLLFSLLGLTFFGKYGLLCDRSSYVGIGSTDGNDALLTPESSISGRRSS